MWLFIHNCIDTYVLYLPEKLIFLVNTIKKKSVQRIDKLLRTYIAEQAPSKFIVGCPSYIIFTIHQNMFRSGHVKSSVVFNCLFNNWDFEFPIILDFFVIKKKPLRLLFFLPLLGLGSGWTGQ